MNKTSTKSKTHKFKNNDELKNAYKQLPRLDKSEDDDLGLEEFLNVGVDENARLEQPLSHEEQQSLCMKMFPALASKTNLSQAEIEQFYELKTVKVIKYDLESTNHEAQLLQLANVLFSEMIVRDSQLNNLKGSQWREFGFQSDNPRTDFRGAGILAVENLRYFAQRYDEHFLIVFFHLTNGEQSVMPHLLKYKAKRSQLKNFLRLQTKDTNTLAEIHSIALCFMFHFWKKNVKRLENEKQNNPKKAQQLIMSKSYNSEPSEWTFKFIQTLLSFKLNELVDVKFYGEILSQYYLKKKFKMV
ncbi:elmo domain-containing protein a [Stylonychia lemnae]|uniref:Elmo domain-containing protein a n=1 Tax=Stylonychia lemnae TaxID=5949 RepID=A0A078AN12_STYLE|nr:elmo domain-containing protein a [Stylonychia lemnae]|eukprot:CDW83321.1 elmo domain-containing protein a [Stylonychia lemnae]